MKNHEKELFSRASSGVWEDEDSQSASSSSKMVICLEDSLFSTMPGVLSREISIDF